MEKEHLEILLESIDNKFQHVLEGHSSLVNQIEDTSLELLERAGLVPYEDIDIVFTGLRPGEKLFEELLIDGEGALPTAHEKIRVLAPVQISIESVKAELEVLYQAARTDNVQEMIQLLKRIVPEYRPSYHFNGDVPLTFQRVRPDLFPGDDNRKVIHLPKRA